MREIGNIFNVIDRLKVSKGWIETFKKIQVSYYNNFYQGKANNVHTWAYSPQLSNMSQEDRFKFFTRFNIWALIFGPLYYIGKFIFLKGFFLLLIEAALIHFYGLPVAYFVILIHIYTAIFANSDYFSLKVLNNKEVLDNPMILSDYIDTAFVKKVVRRTSFFTPFVITAALVSIALLAYIYIDVSNFINYKNIVQNYTPVCSTTQDCKNIIEISSINIRANKKPLYREYFNLAAGYYALGSKQAAIAALDKATADNRRALRPYILRGIIYTELKYYTPARENYKKALEIYPQGKFLYYLLGSSYYKEGNYTEAKKNFEKATKAYPDKATYWEALAYTKLYMKDSKGAKEDLQKAIRVLNKEGQSKNAAKIESLENYIRSIR